MGGVRAFVASGRLDFRARVAVVQEPVFEQFIYATADYSG